MPYEVRMPAFPALNPKDQVEGVEKMLGMDLPDFDKAKAAYVLGVDEY